MTLLPFARNEATRFISPTKTPEYLAGGKPVVSTPIRDVVSPNGEMGLVHIGGSVAEIVTAIEDGMEFDRGNSEWLARVDRLLAQNSWDRTWAGMRDLIEKRIRARNGSSAPAGEPRPNGLTLASD